MTSLHQAWLSTPRPLRKIASSVVRTLHLPLPAIHRFMRWPMPDGFMPGSPHTGPAVEKCLAFTASRNLVGDYYEFGMWRGHTFCRAQQAARELKLDQMRFWGFDSFAGLPSDEGNEKSPEDTSPSKGRLYKGDFTCPKDEVIAYLTQFGVDWSRTKLIEGFFDASLTPDLKRSLGLKPVAVVLVDCDLYVSTVPVLEFLVDLLQEGSIVLFDDWNIFEGADDTGERRAFGEFLRAHREWTAEPHITFGWHGQAFIMHRR